MHVAVESDFERRDVPENARLNHSKKVIRDWLLSLPRISWSGMCFCTLVGDLRTARGEWLLTEKPTRE
jgi:hypothetical protein